MVVISTYAPHSGSTSAEYEQYQESLQDCIDKAEDQDVVIVLGDYNAQVGCSRSAAWRNNGAQRACLGPHGSLRTSERGRKALDFASATVCVWRVGNGEGAGGDLHQNLQDEQRGDDARRQRE